MSSRYIPHRADYTGRHSEFSLMHGVLTSKQKSKYIMERAWERCTFGKSKRISILDFIIAHKAKQKFRVKSGLEAEMS